MVAVQRAAADTPPVESASASALPSNGLSADNFSMNASACGSQSCVAVGEYEFVGSPHSQDHGLIVPITNGAAGAGVATPLPANVETDSSANDALYGVSCWSSASCVAVGDYQDTADNGQVFVVPVTNGVAGSASEVTLPSNSNPDPAADLEHVSCSVSGACVGVGSYIDSSNDADLFVVAINNGVPATAVEVTLPSNDHPSTSTDAPGFEGVSCQASGSCTAVGYYYVGASDEAYAGFVVQIVGGVPAAAAEQMSLPSNSDGSGWFLNHVSCPPTGTCTGIGYYNSYGRVYALPISGGVAGQATEITAPSGSASPGPSLSALGCQSNGDCMAVGTYEDTSSNEQAVVTPIANGVPAASVEVALPAGADGVGSDGGLFSLSCPAAGPCLAAGAFANSTGNDLGMTVSFNAGSVSGAIASPAPSDASSGGSASATLETAACAAASCAASGDYANASGDAPYVVSAQAPLAVGTTSLPAGEIGSAYSQTVSATGAWGISGWTLASGTLPAGLTLNSATGLISGTPTTPGSSTFTVQATGLGTPAQTATQSLSVTVAKAGLKVVGSSATVKKNRFALKLSCSGGSCAGTATLQITESYVVKHGKKKAHKHRTVAIGSVHFSLAAGKTQSYTVALNAAGRKYAKTHTRLTSTVLATVDGVKETAGRLTLKAAATKKKKK
jgi:hypothetical protein